MSELTEKQIKARKYYAENAEKIKAQKRDAYNRKVIKPKIVRTRVKTQQKINLAAHVEAPKERALSARERIENYMIEKELSEYSWFKFSVLSKNTSSSSLNNQMKNRDITYE